MVDGELLASRDIPHAHQKDVATCAHIRLAGRRRPLMLWGLSVEGRAGGTALHAPIYRFYGVMVVANASVVRVSGLPLVCMKTDLNALPLFASPM